MLEHFKEYVMLIKPDLDEAFQYKLRNLLDGTSLNHSTSLLETLWGGKKLRGSLLCLVTKALGGILENAIPRAVAVELIQTATLIHDDFVDQDRVRRKLPATWTLEGSRRAVLLGDVIFASAIKMMNDLSSQDGKVASDAIAQVARGALHEPLEPLVLAGIIESNGMDGSLYEKIIHLKTGILFGAACELGAIAVQGSATCRKSLQRFGQRIGEAYQIADDLQEIKYHIGSRRINAKQMAALTPPCLCFAEEVRPFALTVLKSDKGVITGATLSHFQQVAVEMQAEMEQRLKFAVNEIQYVLPDNEYGKLAQMAPWDLISMFKTA